MYNDTRSLYMINCKKNKSIVPSVPIRMYVDSNQSPFDKCILKDWSIAQKYNYPVVMEGYSTCRIICPHNTYWPIAIFILLVCLLPVLGIWNIIPEANVLIISSNSTLYYYYYYYYLFTMLLIGYVKENQCGIIYDTEFHIKGCFFPA